jgi:apolipoprotein N-acyltransferase
MQEVAAVEALNPKPPVEASVRAHPPTLAEISVVTSSALLTLLSFPDFDLWPLAWVGLVPLLVVVAQSSKASRAFLMGWLWGIFFFYGTCWWLTYPMIHYAHVSAWLAYPLLVLPVALVAIFPGLFSAALIRLIARFGFGALFIAPLTWVSLESVRYMITGQIWNALGYSQAFHPVLIQSARWGGVYAVSFLIVSTNSALAYALIRRGVRAIGTSFGALTLTAVIITGTYKVPHGGFAGFSIESVVAVQPNVPMEGVDDPVIMKSLLNQHVELSVRGLGDAPRGLGAGRLVVWPESPMNFSYSRDLSLQRDLANFAKTNSTSLLLNSLEPSSDGGGYNSAILINQRGEKVAQYDKIRLMPFGEYVPLPRWLPGASSVRAIVGEFKPGSSYTLMPLGDLRAGVFICIEAAHPLIARTFTNEGADVLINISNDGYLGPTAVMRQHLANAILRAVENDRRLIRVTNSGISAFIDSDGRVNDATGGFRVVVRTWDASGHAYGKSFYTRHGDLFAYGCALITLGFVSASFMTKRKIGDSAKRRG